MKKKLPSDFKKCKEIFQDWKKGENRGDIYIYHTGLISEYSLILESFHIGIIIKIETYQTDLNKLSFMEELK
jgi:hypothetical protein